MLLPPVPVAIITVTQPQDADPLPSPTIVVVDDDEEIRDLLGEHLRRAGFAVAALADGRGLDEALLRRAAVVILDVMLPGEDGFSLCRRIRSRLDVPIIMLTASSDEADRVIGLELGADDYVAKPFSPRELAARIKALLRRSRRQGLGPRAVRFGGWHLDLVSHQLQHENGSQVALSGAEFALLNLFVSQPQQILDRDQICKALHGRDALPFDRSIDVQVSRLRQRLGDDQALIRTVRGRGYVLAAAVSHEG